MPSDNDFDADPITVVLADDNLIVREGVRALLARAPAIEVVGVAGDYDELVETATRMMPQVVVTDIRMPPTFQSEGIDAAREIRKRLPGTAIVVLSQFDSPEYVIELLSDGAAGYAYLLKDRVADGDRLARAIREVATGGSMLDPEIVSAMVSPTRAEGTLTDAQEALLHLVAEGRPVKAIAAQTKSTPEAVNSAIENLFMVLAADASAGRADALRHLRMLHSAILDREEQGQTLSRMLPGGLADKLRADKGSVDRTDRLTVTVLMSDVRGYTTIAETADLTVLANQLNAHRREMNAAIIGAGGTVMQYVGDAVMAVFGAPHPRAGHAAESMRAAEDMHARQAALDARWAEDGLLPFGLGIGLSTGEVAAAYLGSTERVEYTVVGDVVNLAQRLQDLARPAGTTVASVATLTAAEGSFDPDCWVDLGHREVKGRVATIQSFARYASHSLSSTES